jgi:gas vesicle protein
MLKENVMAEKKESPYIVVERQATGVGTFLLGVVLGAGIGLLFAPRSGKETRDELGVGLRKLKDGAEDTVQKVQKAVTGTIEEFRDQVNERVYSARQAMEAGREAALRSRADLERRVYEARAAQQAPNPFTTERIDEQVFDAEEETGTHDS